MGCHTVLLRSDGTAVACGNNDWGQCNIPELGDLTYTQVAAGGRHTVLLRSDGTAVACGANDDGQCNIPELGDLTYTQVAAGGDHTVLLRSDGPVVTIGSRYSWQQPRPFQGPFVYAAMEIGAIEPKSVVVLQASFKYDAEGLLNQMVFDKLNGERDCEFQVQAADCLSTILARLKHMHDRVQIKVVLPGGQLMSEVISQGPLRTLAEVI